MINLLCPRCEKSKPWDNFWWSENAHVCKDCAEQRVVDRRSKEWEKWAERMFAVPVASMAPTKPKWYSPIAVIFTTEDRV